ncbi:hypothetical protein KAFR_0B05850 [Kazachstania africana CBS 2517]|uniref:Uncharacterized protein n=1 Tax=Kazachstania africana (strain ATCC 22294 / BCRC 22015 / CBS 2517 / CECT 1963 / NBRC 1671 / NRRL Y-8276) TaxID=1071382 RepID=H2AR81_KAZAF|nr:hypothetical protein KAFR_0B05850 [Kazachstania africana CBS 2517]CCF56881.1 hypothetical protein KAFR_0B05850 [Kazachstania africana CBS 2517]
MAEIDNIIKQARLALSENNPKKSLKLLKPYKKSLQAENSTNIALQQVFADSYLENGQLEKAYPILVHNCEIDPEGLQGGSDKFFTLGQVVGGKDGIQILAQGIENISNQAGENLNQEQMTKIISGLLSMIEIWMTDLCMEPNAESECENLINKAMEISENTSPEAWSTLGSIRISQQRFEDACGAFRQSWKFFEERKNEISKIASESNTQEGSYDEFVDMLQPLLSLAKMCVEVGLYDIALKVENAIKEVDEDNMEGYYLEGFTNYLVAKVETFKESNPNVELTPENIFEFNQHIQELPLDLGNTNIHDNIQDARIALSFAAKLGETVDSSDEIAKEIYTGTLALLNEIGGPIDNSELQKLKKGELLDDELDEEVDLDDISGGDD